MGHWYFVLSQKSLNFAKKNLGLSARPEFLQFLPLTAIENSGRFLALIKFPKWSVRIFFLSRKRLKSVHFMLLNPNIS